MKKLLIATVMLISCSAFASEGHEMMGHDMNTMDSTIMNKGPQLIESVPFDNQMMMGSPETIKLSFDSAVTLTSLSMVADNGLEIDLDFRASDEQNTEFEHSLAELAINSYTITYTIKTLEGQFETGEIWFMVH